MSYDRLHRLSEYLRLCTWGLAGVGALASTDNLAAINARWSLDTPAPTEQGGIAAQHGAKVEGRCSASLKLVDDGWKGAQQPQLQVV
jgi:hypothetical protein